LGGKRAARAYGYLLSWAWWGKQVVDPDTGRELGKKRGTDMQRGERKVKETTQGSVEEKWGHQGELSLISTVLHFLKRMHSKFSL
jgi:hypothetical protein